MILWPKIQAESASPAAEAGDSAIMSLDSEASSQGGDYRSFRQITRDRNPSSQFPSRFGFARSLLLEMDLAKLLTELEIPTCGLLLWSLTSSRSRELYGVVTFYLEGCLTLHCRCN